VTIYGPNAEMADDIERIPTDGDLRTRPITFLTDVYVTGKRGALRLQKCHLGKGSRARGGRNQVGESTSSTRVPASEGPNAPMTLAMSWRDSHIPPPARAAPARRSAATCTYLSPRRRVIATSHGPERGQSCNAVNTKW
jgi:hypothetical protein